MLYNLQRWKRPRVVDFAPVGFLGCEMYSNNRFYTKKVLRDCSVSKGAGLVRSLTLCDGRRELTSASCPTVFTYTHVHICIHRHTDKEETRKCSWILGGAGIAKKIITVRKDVREEDNHLRSHLGTRMPVVGNVSGGVRIGGQIEAISGHLCFMSRSHEY